MSDHRSTTALLAALLALAACQVNVAPPDPRRSPRAVDAKASPAPTARPGAPVPTGQPALAATGSLLKKPAAATATLRGTVAIDASYLVDANAGSVLSSAGASFAAVGQGLLSNNSGSLVSNNSGSLIANNSGNIISDKGAGLISDKGSGLISDKGAGLISDKGAGYQLAQAAGKPEFGATLPAAGMNLRVVSLVDGSAVPLGVDEAGKPVYAIYTNLKGGFEVYLPAALTGTVRVIAEAPETRDGRLSYPLFARTDREDAGAIDEDTAAMNRYVRQGLTSRFLNVLRNARAARAAGGVDDAALISGFFPDADQVLSPAITAFLGELLGAIIAEADKNAAIGPEDYPELAKRLADAVFARGPDLAAIEVTLETYTPEDRELAKTMQYGLGPALANMTTLLKELRLAVVAAQRGKTPAEVEAFYAAKPYIQTANRLRPAGAVPYRIRKASDLADFMAEEYVPLVRGQAYDAEPSLTNGDIMDLSRAVFADLGLPVEHVKALYGSGGAITLAMVPVVADPATKETFFTILRAWER